MKSSKSVTNTSVSVDLDRVRIVSSILVSILRAWPELLRAPLSAILGVFCISNTNILTAFMLTVYGAPEYCMRIVREKNIFSLGVSPTTKYNSEFLKCENNVPSRKTKLE